MTNGKKDILIIMGRYLPGYKDGGPVRSIKNLTDYLGKEYNFKILTCDRDHGDTVPYPDIKVNDWNRVGNADVYYVASGGFAQKIIIGLSKSVDLVYVCGCFNDYAINTLIADKLGKIKVPVVVAAMGLFSPGALQIKTFKKKTFLKMLNLLGMFKHIYWSATSPMEAADIANTVNTDKDRIYIAEDLPRMVQKDKITKNKRKGYVRIVFLSRFTPKKNLKQAIEILQQVRCNTSFILYGPDEDQAYWKKCKAELKKLPQNVHWGWKGNIDSEKVVETLKQYDVFLFPTRGENFDHVIQEALSAGCPCIISNQTPWQDLESKGAGYVFPLDDNKPFIDAIERYADMSSDEFQNCVESAHQYAVKVSNNKITDNGYRKIFKLEGT